MMNTANFANETPVLSPDTPCETMLPAELILRGIAALMEALLFMALSIPCAFLLPSLISRIDATAIVPHLPGLFFVEGLLPGVSAPLFLISLFALMTGSSETTSITQATPLLWTITVGTPLFLNLLYHAGMESSKAEGTLGKLVVGLKVQTISGGRLTFPRALLRNVLRPLSTLPLLAGYFMIAKTAKNQALHDLLSGCVVLRESSPADRLRSAECSSLKPESIVDQV